MIENVFEIIPGSDKDRVRYSDLFDSVRYVRLETTDDILIKDITQLKCVNGKIYILDNKTQTLFCFNMDGKLAWKICRTGQGPQEYSRLTSFDIDERNGKLYLFSARDKISVCDLSGNFMKEYNVRLGGTSFACGGDHLYIYANNNPNHVEGSETNNYLLLFDEEKNILKGKLPFKADKRFGTMNTYNTSDAFCRYGDEVRFFMPFSNSIYSLKEDSVYIKYQFDFGKYNLPDSYFENYTTDDIRESKYAYGLNSFWESNKYFSFSMYINEEYYQILYDKSADKIYTGILSDDISYCSPLLRAVTDDYAMGSLLAEDLFLINNFSKESRENAIFKEIISEMTEDDNPVVFFYYFKK
ncbi:MAG: 6-bladed beta-propeller [Proteiniphilum sp.]|nr:6-bladed beta-propeller [Proteiniphilum sp.]